MSEKSEHGEGPQPAESAIWTLRRSRTDVKLAGLCGALAKHWNVDPVLVRVGFALLALSAGMGVILYLAGWLLLPVEGRAKAPVDDLFGDAVRRWPKEVWIAIVTVACIAMFAIFGSISPFSIGPAVVIAVIWYFGFYKPRQARARSAQPPPAPLAPPTAPQFVSYPGPPTPFTEAAQAWQRRIEDHAKQTGGATAPSWPAPPPGNLDPTASAATYRPARTAPDRPPVTDPDQSAERDAFLANADPVGLYVEPVAPAVVATPSRLRRSARRLRLVALLGLGLVMSGLGLADYLGAPIPLAAYFAGGLLVLGVALVVATWLGRARGLLGLGVLLAVATVIAAAAPVAHLPTVDNSVRTYRSATELPAGGDSIDVGNLTADLSQVELTSDATYRASVDLGNLTVVVPKDVRVVVAYSADLGSVRIDGRDLSNGNDTKGTFADPQEPAAGQRTLNLDLSVDVGNVEVRQ